MSKFRRRLTDYSLQQMIDTGSDLLLKLSESTGFIMHMNGPMRTCGWELILCHVRH